MGTIAALDVLLRLNMAEFSRDRTKAELEMLKLNATIKRVSSIAAGAFAVVGGGAAVSGLVSQIHATMEAIDVNAKLSDRLGITTESLLGMQHAANLAGVDVGSFNADIEKMVKNLGEAAINGGPVDDAFKAMGLSARTLASQSIDKSMEQIADGIAAVENPAERAALATTIFGKSGQALLNTLSEGAEGLRKNTQEVKDLNAAYSRTDAAKVEAALDALTRTEKAMEGLKQQVAITNAPAVEAIANAATKAVPAVSAMAWQVLRLVPGIDGMATGVQLLNAEMDGLEKGPPKMARLAIEAASAAAAMEKLKAEAKAVNAQFDDPENILNEKLKTLYEMAGEGLISIETLVRAIKAANQAAANTNPLDRATAALSEQAVAVGKNAREMELFKLEMLGADAVLVAYANHVYDLIDAEQRAASVNQVIDSLREQVDAMRMSERELTLYRLRSLGASEAAITEALAILETKDSLDRMNKSLEDQARLRESMKAEGKRIFEETRTPAERLAATLDHLDDLFANGAFGKGADAADTYSRAVANAREEFNRLTKATGSVGELGAFDMLVSGKGNPAAKPLDQALSDFVLPPAVVRGLDANTKGPIDVRGQDKSLGLLSDIKRNTAKPASMGFT